MTAIPRKTAKPAEEKDEKKEPKKAVARRKAVAKEEAVEAAAPAAVVPEGGYVYAVGRRKTSVAQAKLWTTGSGDITVNGKPYGEYFPRFELRDSLTAPLKAVGHDGKVTLTLKVSGGGIRGQAEAARLGISRALLEINPEYRKTLKAMGFLTRDDRKVERKKYGLRKARRAPQWAKR
ncbi:30S ribosomal protein S9 [Candidatus Uhrbacteria bacterium]|nr:30S ribosomal protein S9 [Candidatus Uhrbacteria bacterium]